MEQKNKNLVYAIYNHCKNNLYTNSDNTKNFITLFNKSIEINKEFIFKLMELLNNLSVNPKLITLPDFKYNKYKNICEEIDNIINEENKIIIKPENKLKPENKNDYLTILLLVLSTTGKITDSDTFMQLYEFDDTKINSVKINIDNFINDYNTPNKTILDILEFIRKYELYKIFNVTNTHDELKILSLLHTKILTNILLVNVGSYKNKIYNLCIPFTKEGYNDILKSINSGIYNSIIDLSKYNFEDKTKELVENGVISNNVKDLFKYVVDNTLLNNDDINKLSNINFTIDKSNTINACISGLLSKTAMQVYESKDLNIDTLYTVLLNELMILFNKVTEYNNLGTVITNKCDDTTIKDILILFSKSKNDIKNISVDKKPIDEFSQIISLQIFGDNTDNLYKEKNENILITLSNIYTAEGKLNITELEKIFTDYVYALILIFSKFNDSDLPLLYLATLSIVSMKQKVLVPESENIIMFKGKVLFEEGNDKILTVKASLFGTALKSITDEAENNNISIIDVCNNKVVKNDDAVTKTSNVLDFTKKVAEVTGNASQVNVNLGGTLNIDNKNYHITQNTTTTKHTEIINNNDNSVDFTQNNNITPVKKNKNNNVEDVEYTEVQPDNKLLTQNNH